jgi:peroxiredoxin
MTFIMNLVRMDLAGVYSAIGCKKRSILNKTLPKIIPILLLGLGLSLIVVAATQIIQDIPPQKDLSAVPAKVKYSAPELELTDTAGNPASLASYRGQVVLVNLWATWCPPCKEEMPAFEAFYRKHRDEGFVIVAINDGDPKPDVLQFVEEYGLTFPVWLDPSYIATEQAFKTLNLPSSFVIDRKGTIVLSWVGGTNIKTLEKYVTPIIKEGE